MENFVATIGLEIHAELKTRTKMFCDSRNDMPGIRPNCNVCPVCMAHPGTLPVINKEAVRQVLRVGVALGANVADYAEFDRKNYFYPDLPKGYQLSQYEYPLVTGGELLGVKVTRVHLEEDTASSMHDERNNMTLIDFNRAGVPLMELVTEPVIHSAIEAGNFGRELQLLLRYLGASDADMEKGQMRLEANVSVGPSQSSNGKSQKLGTKVEIKNINSFRAMERAIDHEIRRQIKILQSGSEVTQETRGWDENKQSTFPQRVKEGSEDYRYFPDPDLPSLQLSEIPEFGADSLRETLPELPWERRERYKRLDINAQDIELYVKDPVFGAFFESVSMEFSGDGNMLRVASNYIANDLVSLLRHFRSRDSSARDSESSVAISISPANFCKLIRLVTAHRITSRAAKDLLAQCISNNENPEKIALEKKLLRDEAIDLPIVTARVLADNASVVTDLRAGKAVALEYLVGQGMKALRGAADPNDLRNEIEKQLKA